MLNESASIWECSRNDSETHYAVKIYPNPNDRHLSPIYAGLYDLLNTNRIELAFSQDFSDMPVDLKTKRLWMEVRDLKSGMTRKICFDMRDGSRHLATDAITKADIYFKRSYDGGILSRVEKNLRAKVFPYGLYFPCRSKNESITLTLKRLYLHHKTNQLFSNSPYHSIKNTLGHPIKLFLDNRFTNSSAFKLYPIYTSFEVGSKEPAQHAVLFLTQVWDCNDVPLAIAAKRRDLNEMRVETIRALRSKFKESFIGGLRRTPFAEKHYPDCISTWDTDKANFIKILKRCLIAVTTTGLHESVGAKLAEYIVASRCVVTEPLKQTLPTPLKEEENILTFNDPDTCVKACERILDSAGLANEMRKNNEAYYKNELKPSVLMYKHLQTAFSHPVQADL